MGKFLKYIEILLMLNCFSQNVKMKLQSVVVDDPEHLFAFMAKVQSMDFNEMPARAMRQNFNQHVEENGLAVESLLVVLKALLEVTRHQYMAWSN